MTVLLTKLLTLIILGFLVASLEMCFQHIMLPGMIFNFYKKWLYKVSKKSTLGLYIAKPLGYCPYCHGIWLAIFTYLLFYTLELEILLFIGITWFFIYLLDNKLHFGK